MYIYKNALTDSVIKSHPVSTVKHEILHIVLEHCIRSVEIQKHLIMKYNLVPIKENMEKVHFFVNLAMDAKDNHMLALDGDNVDWGFTGLNMWKKEEIEKDSVEELVEKIFDPKNKPQAGGFGAGIDILQWGDDGNGTTIQEGDKSFDGLEGKELLDKLKQKVVESVVKAKLAGVEKGGILRRLEEDIVLPKQQTWWLRLRSLLRSQLIKSKISDWRVVNRKLPNLIAGSRLIKKPKTVCCIDVSGSIGDWEYSMFVKEMLLASKESEVTAVFWDAGIQEIRRVRDSGDMKRSVQGGGGTVFKPVIKKLDTKQYDILICLTDGYWSDTDAASEAIEKLHNIYKILLTTGSKIEGFNETIEVKMGEDD